MPISQIGAINPAALTVADVYVQIVPPQFLLNGVPTNILGLVGSAEWGPVDQPVTIGDDQQFLAIFGQIQARPFDMGTALRIARQQGASAFKCVRVTDGSDAAATILVQANCITFTSRYTGKRGNLCRVLIDSGSYIGSHKVRVAMPGLVPELFDNIGQAVASVTVGTPGTGYTTAPVVTFSPPPATWIGGRAARGHATVTAGAVTAVIIDDPGNYPPATTPTITFGGPGTNAAATAVMSVWPAVADAVNNGQSQARGPSELVVATVGVGTTAPATGQAYQLAGGLDGAAGVGSTIMLGEDTLPRTGMYALRGHDVSILVLCDLTDTTTWAAQVAFALAEGIYPIMTGSSGQGIAAAISAKQAAGIDTYAAKVMLGDWGYWHDTVNGLPTRLVSPQAFAAGRLANLSPQHSSLNKRVEGLVATQKSVTGLPYTTADLQELAQAGIDVICNPVPGGRYFGARNGRNASSNAAIHGDNYTRMINFVAATLNKGMGIYVGQLHTPDTRRRAKVTLESFLLGLQQQDMIGNPDGVGDAFEVIMDNSNNPQARVALGYMQANVRVTFLSVVEFFIVNLEGGQTVTVRRVTADQSFVNAA